MEQTTFEIIEAKRKKLHIMANFYRLGGVVEECPPRMREVAGSIPGRVITKSLKTVVIWLSSSVLRTVGLTIRLTFFFFVKINGLGNYTRNAVV